MKTVLIICALPTTNTCQTQRQPIARAICYHQKFPHIIKTIDLNEMWNADDVNSLKNTSALSTNQWQFDSIRWKCARAHAHMLGTFSNFIFAAVVALFRSFFR